MVLNYFCHWVLKLHIDNAESTRWFIMLTKCIRAFERNNKQRWIYDDYSTRIGLLENKLKRTGLVNVLKSVIGIEMRIAYSQESSVKDTKCHSVQTTQISYSMTGSESSTT
ncbi:CLUMA_CG000699, isoform A [Clunio marinus]|uniref:CLUMA_CG000699, isoform A n=1 Tax=Clunio marinus TaxID=568069 RepID=A0A1J1HH42_9DIPT|nr:CLUMA_CG000699, isoform A [Clunio marinus]